MVSLGAAHSVDRTVMHLDDKVALECTQDSEHEMWVDNEADIPCLDQNMVSNILSNIHMYPFDFSLSADQLVQLLRRLWRISLLLPKMQTLDLWGWGSWGYLNANLHDLHKVWRLVSTLFTLVLAINHSGNPCLLNSCSFVLASTCLPDNLRQMLFLCALSIIFVHNVEVVSVAEVAEVTNHAPISNLKPLSHLQRWWSHL